MLLFLIILFTLIGSVFSLIGGVILFQKKKWSDSLSIKLVSFSAGVLLTTAFVDLLPEALEESGGNEYFFMIIFGAIVGFFFLERTFFWYHHRHEGHHGIEPSTYLLLLGDSIHNFIDGVIIAGTFLVSIPLGISTSLAVAAHEIPQEIADFSIMRARGFSKNATIKFNLFSALTSLVGAVLTFYFASFLEGNMWIIIALSGGMFIYIATADLIPELHEAYKNQRSISQSFYFIFGIVITFFFIKIVGYFVHI